MTFAEEMLAKYQAALRAAPAGVSAVSVDGNSISYANLVSEYERWKRVVEQESGVRPVASTIRLSGV